MLVIHLSRNGFNPFGDSQQQRECTQSRGRIGKGSHEVDAPDIKDFDDQNRSEKHLISTG